jgi:hypothetical protein
VVEVSVRSEKREIMSSKLIAYAAATAAMGLAGAKANAAIVYTDPDTKPLQYPMGGSYPGNGGINVDFNGDYVPDDPSTADNEQVNSEIFVGSLTVGRPATHVLKRQESGPGGVNGTATGSTFFAVAGSNDDPAALNAGDLIGPTSTFGNTFDVDPGDSAEDDAVLLDAASGGGNFPASSGTTRYIGLRFAFRDTPSELHYGWIGLQNLDGTTGAGVVTDWAYESTPDTAITAGAVPEPTGLALLALGAAAGVVVRPRRRV